MSGRMPPILLIGGGKMGEALAKAWQAQGRSELTIVEPDPVRAEYLRRSLHVDVSSDPAAMADADGERLVVLAVKPAVAPRILPDYQALAAGGALFISIAAGCPLSTLTAGLRDGARIVRVMPNTPVAVGCGMSVGCANPETRGTDRVLVETLFKAAGDFLWVENESDLHAVTALSGSGPAYVFHMTEALAEAGAALGIDPGLAGKLARMTVIGAGELLRRSQESADTLRRNVTSPGGTTEAALEHLMSNGGLRELLGEALACAARRSREIEETFN